MRKRVEVTDAQDAREKRNAATLLGLKSKILAQGTWTCSDGELLFANSAEVTVGVSFGQLVLRPLEDPSCYLVRGGKLVLEIEV